jgi:hypothetical protein
MMEAVKGSELPDCRERGIFSRQFFYFAKKKQKKVLVLVDWSSRRFAFRGAESLSLLAASARSRNQRASFIYPK